MGVMYYEFVTVITTLLLMKTMQRAYKIVSDQQHEYHDDNVWEMAKSL